MRKLNLYISPLYIISAFLMIYFGALDVFCYYFVALWLHELSHYFVSKRLGYMLDNLNFLPFGARLQGDTNYKKRSHELMVSLSGPLMNIIVALLLIAMWWINPIVYAYTKTFVEANLYLGIFNLLPIFPLDGGQAVLSFFKRSKRKVYNIMRIFGIAISVICMGLFFYSAFDTINFSLFFISLFMLITSLEPYNVDVYKISNNIEFKLHNATECKSYAVSIDTNFLNLSKYFSNSYFINFIFLDHKQNVVKVMTQSEILKCIDSGKYFVK